MEPSQSVIGAAFGGPRAAEPDVDSAELLRALKAVRNGDFSVRLPATGPESAARSPTRSTRSSPRTQRLAERARARRPVVGKRGQDAPARRAASGRSGAWGAMETSVNTLIDDLLWPTTEVTRAIAARREGRPLADDARSRSTAARSKASSCARRTIVNTMIEQMSVFTSEVTRVAREVGTDGKLGGQAQVQGRRRRVEGPHRQRQLDGGNLTAQVRNIAEVTIAVANGDLSRKITVDVRGEILQLKEAINTMVDQLRVVRVRGDARRARGRHRGQARRPGASCRASRARGRT